MSERRVVIVDGHDAFRDEVARYLALPELRSVVVAGVGTVREGLDTIAALHPEIILIDVSLPDGSGLAAARHIREMWPMVRIIVISDVVTDDYRQAAFGAGAAVFVSKMEVVKSLPSLLDALAPMSPAPSPDTPPDPSPGQLRAQLHYAAAGNADLVMYAPRAHAAWGARIATTAETWHRALLDALQLAIQGRHGR